MSFHPHQVGDRGQRYEVHYLEFGTGKDRRFGWSNETHELADACRAMPSAAEVYVLDRKTKHEWV